MKRFFLVGPCEGQLERVFDKDGDCVSHSDLTALVESHGRLMQALSGCMDVDCHCDECAEGVTCCTCDARTALDSARRCQQ